MLLLKIPGAANPDANTKARLTVVREIGIAAFDLSLNRNRASPQRAGWGASVSVDPAFGRDK